MLNREKLLDLKFGEVATLYRGEDGGTFRVHQKIPVFGQGHS